MAENTAEIGSIEDRSSTSSKELDMDTLEGATASAMTEEQTQKMEGLEEKPTLETGIDRLLQQHRSDIMHELKRLQQGDRPVTGQDNRKNVEDFFARSLDPQAPVQEENRPESVVVEVRGLVERRPVSSILQSAGFRRNLERALRGSLATLQPQYTLSRNAQRRASSRPSTPSGSNSVSGPATPEMSQATRPVPTPRSRVNRHQQVERSPSPVSSVSSGNGSTAQARLSFRQQLEDLHLRRQQRTEPATASHIDNHAPNVIPPAPALPPVRPEEYAQAWLQDQVGENEEGQGVPSWDSMEQSYRESIITDISELVQRQLVTSTLDGEFRDDLEVLMRGRLEASGIDGSRVQSVVDQLPRLPANMRNNFSDLGIGGANGFINHDNISDNVSVISATAAVTIPHAQSTAVMSREMNSLKSQMQELKNMMKMSFDLQLDIQRSIRQEVSAAIANALGNGGGDTACSSCQKRHASTKPVDNSKCLICLDQNADAVLYQCGHLCLCFTCGQNLRQRGARCPVCRAPIKDIIRAYTSGNTD